jgi:hypothetical protein
VLDEIDKQLQTDSLPKLWKLYAKFSISEKYSETLGNFNKYWQPYVSDLTNTCVACIKENTNDPESIDIAESKIIGRTKNGWEIWTKYSGRNGSGGMNLTVSKFDVRHSGIRNFYVHRVY